MRLLIIDDDAVTVEVIRESINWAALGFRTVDCAYNIAMAKEIMERRVVDIAICDIEMPRGSGLDLLKWARKRKYDTEFVFLTNHERFEFVTSALQHQAFGYILKPFDADKVTAEIIRAIEKLREDRRREEFSRLGAYWVENRPAVEQRFWRDMLFCAIAPRRDIIAGEMNRRRIDRDYDSSVRLFLAVVCWNEILESNWGEGGRGILEYGLPTLCAEILLERMTPERTVPYNRDERICVACIADGETPDGILRERCQSLLALCRETLHYGVTCYIGEPCALDRLHGSRELLEAWDENNLLERDSICDHGERLCDQAPAELPGIDIEAIGAQLVNGEKIRILTGLRERMEQLSASGQLSVVALRSIQQNLVQAVYVYLNDHGVHPDALFRDQAAHRAMRKATESLYDMMRWQSAFINKAIDFIRELEKGRPLIEKAEQFVKANYAANITRNEVAEHVCLTPEYFAKLYKKETGNSIKHFINACRIGQAKRLLKPGGLSVSEIATNVGFDNISYFSTVFKKHTGVTPNEYKAGGE